MSHTTERLAEHYRQKIRSGELAPGTRLPSTRNMAAEHDVSNTTVMSALGWLRVEGYIVTTQRGSFVADSPTTGMTAYDRLTLARETSSVLARGETKRVTAAELVVPPLYVAELFGIDPGDQVVRREYVTGRGKHRVMLAVSWYPVAFLAQVPDLLSTAPGKGNDLLAQIQEKCGRTVTQGRDAMHGRRANEREAGLLGTLPGDPILAGAHEWSDEQGLIEYGEWCLPERLTIGYEYRIAHPEQSAPDAG